jgi:hypothetical protein
MSDLSGRGNKIFKSGDTVYERSFPNGNFDKLIAGRFIKENVVEAEKTLPSPDFGKGEELEEEQPKGLIRKDPIKEVEPSRLKLGEEGEELKDFEGPHEGEATGEEMEGAEAIADGEEREVELGPKKEEKKHGKGRRK